MNLRKAIDSRGRGVALNEFLGHGIKRRICFIRRSNLFRNGFKGILLELVVTPTIR